MALDFKFQSKITELPKRINPSSYNTLYMHIMHFDTGIYVATITNPRFVESNSRTTAAKRFSTAPLFFFWQRIFPSTTFFMFNISTYNINTGLYKDAGFFFSLQNILITSGYDPHPQLMVMPPI